MDSSRILEVYLPARLDQNTVYAAPYNYGFNLTNRRGVIVDRKEFFR